MSNGTNLMALLANLPALPPPPGVQSNFDHPQTHGKVVIIVGIITTILSLIAVVLRLYARRYVSSQPIWWDDGVCVLAVLGTITHTTLMIKNLDIGLGKHMWDLRVSSFTHQALVMLVVMNGVIAFVAYLVRFSILLLYYRLFNVYDTSRRLVWVGMALCTIIIIPNLGIIINRGVKCTQPGSKRTIPYCSGRTVSTNIVVFDVFNIISDFYILIIPINCLRGLHMSTARKRGLIALFAAGLLASTMAVVRFIWVGVHFSDPDTMRYALWIGLFAILEVNIALLCNCAIFIPAIWKARATSFSSVSLSQRKDGNSRYAMGSSGYGRVQGGHHSEHSGKSQHRFQQESMELKNASTCRSAVEERPDV